MNTRSFRSQRWIVTIAGTFLQLCLGTAYAWSFFQLPLATAFGWSQSMTAWAFSLAICFLGISAAISGQLLPKIGPQKLAIVGGLLFGLGYITASMALQAQSAILLFLTYGLIGGCGLGAGYVTPVATVAKWFPEKKGFATGLVVMGFGLGALAMSKLFAPMLLHYFEYSPSLDLVAQQAILVKVFRWLGILFLCITIPVGFLITNPPSVTKDKEPPNTKQSSSLGTLFSRKFFLIWIIFFCNITAGIAIIGFQSPLFQDLWATSFTLDITQPATIAKLASYGATLIAVTSIFNGIGRFFWGSMSDKIGRVQTFRWMLGTQIVCFILLAYTNNPWLFAVLLCYILLCYGGGFGTIPRFYP